MCECVSTISYFLVTNAKWILMIIQISNHHRSNLSLVSGKTTGHVKSQSFVDFRKTRTKWFSKYSHGNLMQNICIVAYLHLDHHWLNSGIRSPFSDNASFQHALLSIDSTGSHLHCPRDLIVCKCCVDIIPVYAVHNVVWLLESC